MSRRGDAEMDPGALAAALRYVDSEREQRESAPRSQGVMTMGEAMTKAAKAFGVPLSLPDNREPTADELRELPSTVALEAELSRCGAQVARYAGRPSGLAYQKAQTDVRKAEREVRWGWLRDKIVSERTCQCFGDGLAVTNYDSVGVVRVFSWCSCPAGVAARENHRAQQAERHAEQAAVYIAGMLAQADLSLQGFADLTLDSYVERLSAYPPALAAAGRRLTGRLRAMANTPAAWGVLQGPTGTGKSGLAISVGRYLAERGQRVIADTEQHLLDRIRATYSRARGSDDQSELDVLDEFKRVPVLIVDDLGAPNQATDWANGKLFDILNARYSTKLPTFITTNLQGTDLKSYLGPRIWSRLHERTEGERWMIAIDEPDLRQGV